VIGAPGTRAASASAVVDVLSGSPPEVSLKVMQPARSITKGRLTINPEEKLILGGVATATQGACSTLVPLAPLISAGASQAASDCARDFQWVVTSGALDLSDTAISSSKAGYRNVVILPNSVTGGSKYTLQLSVADGGSTGRAQVDVRANIPPVGGVADASPSNGTQFNTTFVFTQSGWYDTELPLSYSFDYRVALSGEVTPSPSTATCAASATGWTIMVGSLVVAKHSDDKLPQGDVLVRAVAADAIGARGCFFTRVLISPPAIPTGGSTASLVTDVLASVQSDMAMGQAGAVQAIGLLASMLNDDVAVTTQTSSANEAAADEEALPPPAPPPLTGDALAEQEQLREQMIGMLSSSVPSSSSSAGDKKGFAQAVVSVLGVTDAISDSASASSLNMLGSLSTGLQSSDANSGVVETIAAATGQVVKTQVIFSPPPPPPLPPLPPPSPLSPWPAYPPSQPPPPPDWGGRQLWSVRRLLWGGPDDTRRGGEVKRIDLDTSDRFVRNTLRKPQTQGEPMRWG